MKRATRLLCFCFLLPLLSNAQIITPVIRANFGVDADLRNNFFNGALQANNDDWFHQTASGTGEFVIDTTGAAAHLARYAIDVPFRRQPFHRNMRFSPFTVINNKMLIDALFVRDYHGDDSTVFASGGNKNGMSPQSWSCPVAQSIPDKNELLDMLVHLRRDGTNPTDSLWLMGGVSIENTTGNRYFDFEMYQTDFHYDRSSRKFSNYGPDAGHTSWKFDATGNVVTPGDVIFSAEYSSASLSLLEARIWISRSDWQTVVPTAFNWGGQFDGDGNGSEFGYASVTPKASGAFYTGLQSANNTWAGPFSLVLGDNTLVNNYTERQFMEFSVNLTKLGLDPLAMISGSDCRMPFRKIFVKSRSSTSFTSELKDFIGPYTFYLAPAVEVETQSPFICESGGISRITVRNPVANSIYQWSTPNGHIIGSTTGTYIDVDTTGTYIVTQLLQAGCAAYASDTIQIQALTPCTVLGNNLYDFRGTYHLGTAQLSWKLANNESVAAMIVERSVDGKVFQPLTTMTPSLSRGIERYAYIDMLANPHQPFVYYRIKTRDNAGYHLSPVLKLKLPAQQDEAISLSPNPARDLVQLHVNTPRGGLVQADVYDQSGKLIWSKRMMASGGYNTIVMADLASYPRGIYQVVVTTTTRKYSEKLLLMR